MSSADLQKAGLDDRFQSKFTVANGVHFHYVIGGSGEPLVLLHGYPLTWYSWRKIMPALAEHYTVIVPDLPGLGDSKEPSAGFEKSAIAEDIRALVHELGFQNITLIGHDMGAPVAYAYARQHPSEVDRLVILDVPLTGYGLREFGQRLHLWHFDFFEAPGLPETLLEGRERQLIESFYPSYNPTAITSADVDEYVRSYTAPGSLKTSLEYYRAFAKDEQWMRETSAPKLEMPVLAIGGEFAGAAAPFASLVQLAHNVTGKVLPNCGHYLAEEQPTALLQELFQFLALTKTAS
jgi:pimeloyl-ACP methyl ester carboxylesterase